MQKGQENLPGNGQNCRAQQGRYTGKQTKSSTTEHNVIQDSVTQMHLCCHVFLGMPVTPAPSGSHHPWLGPHGTAPVASRCTGSLGAQVREGWVRQQPGAAGARSQDGGGCGEQGAACRVEASRGRSAGTWRQRWGPGHLPGAAGEGAGRLRLWCPAGGATREKPTPLPAHQTPQASDHVITALPPLSTSTVLLNLSAAHGGLFWGCPLPAGAHPHSGTPLCPVSHASRLVNPALPPFRGSPSSTPQPWGSPHPSDTGPPQLGSPRPSPHHTHSPSPSSANLQPLHRGHELKTTAWILSHCGLFTGSSWLKSGVPST